MQYKINPESGIPMYRQLADIISAEIKSGAMPSGTKLPTVRELAEETQVARGTVKRAYEELRRGNDSGTRYLCKICSGKR